MNFKTYKNFITESERNDLLTKVLWLRRLWYRAEPERQTGLEGGLYVLGNCIYLGKRDEDIDKQMYKLFSSVYYKIAIQLSEHTGIESTFSDTLPPPGFHISELKEDVSHLLHFHTDSTIQHHIDNVDLDKVRSMLIMLEAPEGGAHLETIYAKHPYEVDALHVWNGGIEMHRMGGLKCSGDEKRITLQCHSYYDEEAKKNIIYF